MTPGNPTTRSNDGLSAKHGTVAEMTGPHDSIASRDDLDLIAADVLARHHPDTLVADRCANCTPFGHFDVPPDPVPWPCPTAKAAMRAAPTVQPPRLSMSHAIMAAMSDTDRTEPVADDPINLDAGDNADWLRITAERRRRQQQPSPQDEQ
jgi:hypothetical protein